MNWKPMDRDLVEGEIIRTRYQPGADYFLYNDEVEEEGKFRVLPDEKSGDKIVSVEEPTIVYARAHGGFGMHVDTRGNAIFVKNISEDFEETEQKTSPYRSRWERYWGIEVMV